MPRPCPDNAIHTHRGLLVLLFYDGYELKAIPGLAGALYSRGRFAARYVVRSLKRAQVWTGFYTAFRSLRTCLLQAGCDVRVNDFALAMRNPRYPVGLAGYPSVLTSVRLPNPTIFGPGDYGLPDVAASLVREPRIRRLIQPCNWAADLYRQSCGDRMFVWPVGIDTDAWPDLAMGPKHVDVLVYDKIRWHRDREVPRVRRRVEEHLKHLGLSFLVLEYGRHHLGAYARALRQSRAMIFLCEHETQGLAYQEAMSCNVPVLAWDEGELVDPQQRRFANPDIVVTSVPYFDRRCGMQFKIEGFERAFDEFWSRHDEYFPRQFVLENLSLAKGARTYLDVYTSLM